MSYVELMVEIYMIDFEVMKYLKFYCQIIEDRWVFDIDLFVKGEYFINVFVWENLKCSWVYNVYLYFVFLDGYVYRDIKEEFKLIRVLIEII